MKRETLLLILIIAIAAGLRLYDLTYQGLWGDEAFSVYDAKGVDMHFMTASLVDVTHRKFFNPYKSVRTILRACIRNEGTPPAYFIALALWIKTFGNGDFVYRSFSAILGVLAVVFTFLLGRRLWGEGRAALLAALFTAVSPINIYFSQEARAYMLAHCAVLAASWLLLRALDSSGRALPWAGYVCVSLLVCYTFYFAAIVLAAHLAYVLLCERRKFRPFALSILATGLLYCPWLIMGLRTQFAVSSGYVSLGPAQDREFLRAFLTSQRYILDSLILGPMYSREVIGERVKSAIEWGLLALLAAGCVRLWTRGARKAVIFSLLVILVPLAAISALGCMKWTLWYMKPRYHLWETTGIFLLVAGTIATFRSALARTALAGAFCLFSLAAAPYHFYPGVFNSDHAKSDFRGAASIVSRGEEPGDLILVNIPGHMIPFNIYYKGGMRQIGIAECGRYNLVEELRRRTAKRKRVWLLVDQGTRGHGDREITGFLDESFETKRAYPLRGLDLRLYSRLEPASGQGG